MDFSSAFRRFFSQKTRRESGRRENWSARRLRLFETLEARQMLDAASFYETLPEIITIAETDQSYHYAIVGQSSEIIDASSVSGLTASLPEGPQVAFTVLETKTNGAVSTLGEVVVQLFSSPNEAPISSNHFLDLVAEEYYEGLSIHRILPGFMFQGGSPEGDGIGGSGLSIVDEHSDVLTHSRRGVVSYANSGPGTSDAQFFVMFDAAEYLDGSYNVFGYVVSGYDVVDYLESVDVVDNGRGEKSSPVDSYTFSNFHVVEENDVSSGVLRLVADENASGSTSVSLMTTYASGESEMQETTVYVGDEGLADYLRATLDEIDFDITAGDSIEVNLPEEFGGYDVTYTIAVNEDAARYGLVTAFTPPASNPDAQDPWTDFTIKTDRAGAQTLSLTISARVNESIYVETVNESEFDESAYGGNYQFYDGTETEYEYEFNSETGELTPVAVDIPVVYVYKIVNVAATATQDVVVSPVKPEVSLVADSVANYEGVMYTASSFLNDEVVFSIDVYRFEEPALQDDGLLVALDGEQYSYSRVYHAYNEETGLDRYEIRLNLDHEPDEGVHTLTVQDAQNAPTLSEATTLKFNYDPTLLAFVEFPSTITAKVGEAGTVKLATNKTNADGSQRADVAFSLVDSTAVSSFLTLSEDGVLSWTAPTEAMTGTYNVVVQATDALGRVASSPLTFAVGGALTFAEFTDVDALTGSPYLGQISAYDSSDPEAVVRYELVDEANLTINPTTGVLSWAIPSDYLAGGVKTRLYDFTVKATEMVEQEDGSYVDSEDSFVSKKFTLTITNDSFEEDATLLPTWKTVEPQNATAGTPITIATVETAPTDVVGVEYRFTTDVPEGMTINSDGEVQWTTDADFFGNTTTPSRTYTVGVAARSIVDVTDKTIDYTDSTTTSFTVKLANPNYVEAPPVLNDLEIAAVAQTGATFSATVTATDPNETSDRIVFAIVNDAVPEGLTLDATSGALTWAIASDYLAENVSAQTYSLTVKATKQTQGEDGAYVDGLSATRTYEILVANASATTLETPTIAEVAAQTVEAGKKLEFAVSATLPEGSQATGVRYDFAADAVVPEGMTINKETGVVTYDVPSDYFATVDPETDTVTTKVAIQAQTVVSTADNAVNYGGSATTEVEITVTRPEEVAPTVDTWQEWFNAWLDMTQQRYDAHATNLATYLSAYLAAVEKREADVATAVASYHAGETSLTDLLKARSDAQAAFNGKVETALSALETADAAVETTYAATLTKLNEAYQVLEEANKTPADADAQKEKAVSDVNSRRLSNWTGNSNFRLHNKATGVRVGLDCESAIKMWRSGYLGYSESLLYDRIFSDPTFIDEVAESGDAESGSTDSGSADSGSTDSGATSSDSSESGAAE